MRNKSLKFAFWGAIVPSTLFFSSVGYILHKGMMVSKDRDREDLIHQTIMCLAILFPGLIFKVLAQKEKTFACTINAKK